MPERCEGARPRVTHASVPEYLRQSTRIPALSPRQRGRVVGHLVPREIEEP